MINDTALPPAGVAFPAGIEARWLGDGVLQLLPTGAVAPGDDPLRGVHGNETAPIEMLLQITHDLSEGRQPLSQALLIVFGNLPAIRAGAAICITT
jgi:succinylglutamate desuccinylase